MMTSTLRPMAALFRGVALSVTLGAQPALAQIAPALTVLRPADGGWVGGAVPVEARASDVLGIRSVILTVDGGGPAALTLDTVSRTFKGTWQSAAVADGAHTLTVTVLNTTGLITVQSLRVTSDNTRPSLGVASPLSGSSVSGTVPVRASAADAKLSAVEFQVDGGAWHALTLDPSSGVYTGTFDSTTVGDGSRTLTARALDAAGNVALQAVSLNVANTVACRCFTSQTLDQVFAILPPSADPAKIQILGVDERGFTTFDYFDGSLISLDGSLTGLTGIGSLTGRDHSLNALSIYINLTYRTTARPAHCVVATTPAIDILREFTGEVTDAEADACRAQLLGSRIWISSGLPKN